MNNLLVLNTSHIKFEQRKEKDILKSNIRITNSDIELLSYIGEFKVLSNIHICRLKKHVDKRIQFISERLRVLWIMGLIERFRIYTGENANVNNMPLLFVLSEDGAKALVEHKGYTYDQLKYFKYADKLFEWGLFNHEIDTANIASMEACIKDEDFNIELRGEEYNKVTELIHGKIKEVFTPDYSSCYKFKNNNTIVTIYNEIERGYKTFSIKTEKLERYYDHLQKTNRLSSPIRLFFINENIEASFWKTIILDKGLKIRQLNIYTTNFQLIKGSESFLDKIYFKIQSVNVDRSSNGVVEINKQKSTRVKLEFLEG